jgi:phosphotransferase system IIB component
MVYSDLQVDFSNFLRTYAIWICLGIILIIFITLFFLLVLPKIRQKRKKATSITDAVEWINSLGGSNNIINFSSSRSRLTLEVKDSSLVDQNKLKLLGVSSIIIMSQKIILVIDNGADEIKEKIEKYI